MTVAHYWANRVIENRKKGELWILCTEDKALKEIANFTASSYHSEEHLKDKTKFLFLNFLGEKEGTKVYDLYNSLVTYQNDTARRINKLKSTIALYPIIDELEKDLLKNRSC